MSNNEDTEFETDNLEEEDEYEISVQDALEEITDELSTQSEILEELVSVQRERLEGEQKFQEQLISLLEKLVNK